MGVALVALSPSLAAYLAQQPVFRANTDLVRVDVLVTDGGRRVAGLTAQDFELEDNGVRQEIQVAATAEGVKVVLVLDTSQSVAGRRLEYLKRAIHSSLTTLGGGDTASLLTFNEQLSLRLDAERDAANIERAMERVNAGGRTALYDALYCGLSLVAQDTGRSLIVLFSDGGDNASFLFRDAVMASVQRSKATIYVVGVKNTELVREGQLQVIADDGGGNMLWAEDDSHLPSVFASVFDEFRSRYLLTYMPTGVKRDDGWHRITVRLKGKPGKVKARPGYFATPEPP
jgi:VWFA-related protein